MKSLLIAAVFGAMIPAAYAQVPGAIGHPLPSPDLAPNTISVRVIAGKISDPVVGVDVTLVVNGTPRVARTDSAGRAQFPNLPPGATVKASVLDEDKKETASDEFQISADTGQRLMLSTKPFQPMGGGGGGAAPFAGGGAGGAGMPEPRQLSGEPRPEATDQPGTYTVRLSYDDMADKSHLEGIPVFLVGYSADDSVKVYRKVSDAEGRAQFTDLDRTGSTSYFATAQMARGAVIDRLASTPAVLDSRSGVRLMLSSEKQGSTESAVDDLSKIDKQDGAPPEPGKLRVALLGVPEETGTVELVAFDSAGGHRTIGTGHPTHLPVNPADLQAQSKFTPQADMPAHTLRVQVHGGGLDQNNPLGGASVRLVPAAAATPGADLSKIGTEQKSPDTGFYQVTDSTKGPLVAAITINGKDMTSQPFDLADKGGVLDIEAHWDLAGKLVTDFDTSGVKPDEVLVAQTTMFVNHTLFRSVPFQPVSTHGTKATLFIYPRILFSFSLTSHIDDEFLAIGGKFEVTNNSWAPYIGGTDGMIIPLPKGYKGARVGEQDQDDVAVAQDLGFRIGKPIPPGGKTFHAQFSLPVDEGEVDWSLDLPLGAFQSEMEIRQTPGMSVQVPPGVRGQTVTVPQGTFFVLPQISIKPKQSMHMVISNLPSIPSWRVWAPRIAGILTILTMLGGLGFALYKTSSTRVADAGRDRRRSELLEELVELEKSGKRDDKRRAKITSELEQLWVD